MHKFHGWVLMLLGVVSLTITTSCRRSATHSAQGVAGDSSALAGDTLSMRYSRLLSVVKYEHFTRVDVKNPWDTLHSLHTYLLVERSQAVPHDLPQGTVVRIPLNKSVVYSSVHCGLIEELGAQHCIAGVCDLRYIALPFIQQACKAGRMADLGSSMNPDIEHLIQLNPDAILLSPFENSGGYGRLDKLDIPLIECADYMESSPLARAEWMRFYGLLYGEYQRADSLFAAVEHRYLSYVDSAAVYTSRPTVFSEMKQGGMWYVPGGESTVGRLFAHAGAQYVFESIPESGSVALSFETVLSKAGNADFWLIKHGGKDKTYADIQADYSPYARFKAFTTRHIYACNVDESGYYEETPFHPDVLLLDLIKIFHPQAFCAVKSRYFRNLAP